MPARDRAQRFALELDGTFVGMLVSAEGGDISAPVLRDSAGADVFVHKRLGRAGFEGITLQVGLRLAKSFYQWIANSWAGKATVHDGAVLSLDQAGHVLNRRQFTNARIEATALPALDGASEDAAHLSVRIAPERVADQKGTGKIVPASKPALSKRWLPSNFRLEIESLETTRVRRIEALVVTTVRADPATATEKIDFPDLRITLAESGAARWQTWLNDFVIKGEAAQTKAGSLALLAPDMKTKLASVGLEGLGIRRLAAVPPTSSNRPSELVADLFCERMTFAVTP